MPKCSEWREASPSILQQIADVELVSARCMFGVCKSWTQAFRESKPSELIFSSENTHGDRYRDEYHELRNIISHIRYCPFPEYIKIIEIDYWWDDTGDSMAIAAAILSKFSRLTTICLKFNDTIRYDWLGIMPQTLTCVSFEWAVNNSSNLDLFNRLQCLQDLRVAVTTEKRSERPIIVKGDIKNSQFTRFALCYMTAMHPKSDHITSNLDFTDLSAESYMLTVIIDDQMPRFPKANASNIQHRVISNEEDHYEFFTFRTK